MAQRNDTILHDIISEPYGGSNYYNFGLTLQGFDVVHRHIANWIAPRTVRIINNRFVSHVPLPDGNIRFRRHHGSTARNIIDDFDPVELATTNSFNETVGNSVIERVLSTESSDGYPHVVCRQYNHVALNANLDTGVSTGALPNITVMAHYAFED